MRKLVVGAFISLDGVVQAPGGPDEDSEGGFEHGGWSVPYTDDECVRYMTGLIGRAGAVLFGRKTYESFAATWPLAGDDDPIGAKLNGVPKYVASRTLPAVEWNNSTLLTGDVAAQVAGLKERPGEEIQVTGSGALVQTLLRYDLVDEFHLLVVPVVIGTGKRLFGDGTLPRGLRLAETATTGSGVTISRYESGGELEYGSIGPEYEDR